MLWRGEPLCASAGARARARGDRRPRPPPFALPLLCSTSVEKTFCIPQKHCCALLDNVLAASSRDCRLGPGMTRWLRASNGGTGLAARRPLITAGSWLAWLAGGGIWFFSNA